MSNVRPWFRLSSIARPTSQGSSDPPPPPQPQPNPPRPAIVKQPSPPRQPTPPPPPPQERSPYHSPPSRHMSPPTPPKAKSPPPPPPPKEHSPYHSPPSRHMSPPTPPKTVPPPPPPQPQSSYTPPPPPNMSYTPPPSQPRPSYTPPPPPNMSYTPPPPRRSSYTPPQSPKEVQETSPPPKQNSPPSIKPELRSPKKVLSPYSLPPSQLHSERDTTQKNILTAEKTSHLHEPNHHNFNHQDNNNNIKKTHQHPHHHQQSSSESDKTLGARVITISGENKGAVMEILRSPSRAGTHSYEVFNGAGEKGRKLQSSSDEEGKKKMNLPMKAFMNSNVQMINNSIVYNSTATHHDPGVHLKISRKPGSGNGFHVKDYGTNGGGYTN